MYGMALLLEVDKSFMSRDATLMCYTMDQGDRSGKWKMGL
jgi:hypothetical protein